MFATCEKRADCEFRANSRNSRDIPEKVCVKPAADGFFGLPQASIRTAFFSR